MTLTHNITSRCTEKVYNSHPEKKSFEVDDSLDDAAIKSKHALSEGASPYTEKFFSNLAKTILNNFPFKDFAKENDCEVKDVVRAIRATVLDPLSKPSSEKDSQLPTAMRAVEGTQDEESVNNNALSENRTAATITSFRSAEHRRGTKRRKTMAPVERQLVKPDVYGNYVPTKTNKDVRCRLPED